MSHIGIGGIYLWGYVKRIVFPGNYSSLYLSDRKNTVEWLIIRLNDTLGWLNWHGVGAWATFMAYTCWRMAFNQRGLLQYAYVLRGIGCSHINYVVKLGGGGLGWLELVGEGGGRLVRLMRLRALCVRLLAGSNG